MKKDNDEKRGRNAAARRYVEMCGEAEDSDREFRNLRNMLMNRRITKAEFDNAVVALAAMGKISQSQVRAIKAAYR